MSSILTNKGLEKILATKHHDSGGKKEGREHHTVHHRKTETRERSHEKGKSEKNFKYPLLPIKEVKEKADAGYTFKSAQDEDFKNKDARIVTIKLPKLGYIPFVMTAPVDPNANKVDGKDIKPPLQVALAPKTVQDNASTPVQSKLKNK